MEILLGILIYVFACGIITLGVSLWNMDSIKAEKGLKKLQKDYDLEDDEFKRILCLGFFLIGWLGVPLVIFNKIMSFFKGEK